MKKFLSILTATALVSATTQMPSQAGAEKKNYVAASATVIGKTTGFGATSKFGIAENFSARPFVSILGSSGDTSLYLAGVSATYDFNLLNSNLNPYVGLGYGTFGVSNGTTTVNLAGHLYAEAGVDYNIAESVVINGNYRYFGDDGAFSFGAGYRF